MEEHLSPEEVAEKLHLKGETIRTWLREGRLRGTKAGRVWRVPVSELQRFLQPTGAEQ